jgi:uncharacterized membrane protein (UPF0127 family)
VTRRLALSIRPTSPAAFATILLGALGALCSTALQAQSPPLQDLATFPRATLEIVSGATTHRFSVWIADTPARQTQGLMFVRDLPADAGMVFTECCSGIWMKNTYIELDIVFVGPDRRISRIAEHAKPFDETTIPAGGPVSAVVELRGGEAEKLKLRPGDKVSWTEAH